jgi:predicted CopG family antitoxin
MLGRLALPPLTLESITRLSKAFNSSLLAIGAGLRSLLFKKYCCSFLFVSPVFLVFGELPAPGFSRNVRCMATVSVTLTAEAHARLLKNKLPGDSFSDVVIRELPDPCDTCGELLDRLESSPAPKLNPKMVKAVMSGRGRRSNRVKS